jgi:D-3-phosphoglycerate dehydrogenase / 2-oxoglutarate reductase
VRALSTVPVADDEDALADALDSGHIAGAALDVFETEPAKTHRLFGNDKVVCTPHLGASTREAQETVALQIAEQMSDFLLNGAVSNAVNMPSVTAEEAPRLRPYIQLAELLGAMVGQLSGHTPNALEVVFDGTVAALNTKALSAAAIAGVLRPMIADINMVSAPAVLRERGIGMSEVRRERTGSFEGFIEVRLHAAGGQMVTAAGTVLADGKPRLTDVCGVRLDTGFARNMLYTANTDKPGHIGALGTVLGQAGLNIANFNLGRAAKGGDAVALVHVDDPVPAAVVAAVQALPQVIKVHALTFEFDAD